MSQHSKRPQKADNRPRSYREYSVTEIETPETAELLLMQFLGLQLIDKSRTSIKQVLRDRMVSVNGEAETRATRPLRIGDVVRVHTYRLPEGIKHPLLSIRYQDEDIIVVEKKAGISTVGSGMDKTHTALRTISDHLKQYNPTVRIFMLNRLDKDTAGIILFATSKRVQEEMLTKWKQIVLLQIFRAVIEGAPDMDNGILMPPRPDADRGKSNRKTHPQEATSVLISDTTESAGTATYQVLRRAEYCTLLEVKLASGRNNQIRRQMRQAGTPLAGDRHAGSVYKDVDFVALHTQRLDFKHPYTSVLHTFECASPSYFGKMMRTKVMTPPGNMRKPNSSPPRRAKIQTQKK